MQNQIEELKNFNENFQDCNFYEEDCELQSVLHQKPAIEKSKNRHLSFGDIDNFNSARAFKPKYQSSRKKTKCRSS